jgi:peroxiredoxin
MGVDTMGQTTTPVAGSTPIAVGDAAPDFRLRGGGEITIALRDLRGRPVLLAFYPNDWSPVCGDQLSALAGQAEEFERRGVTLLGISVDGAWSHAAFAEARGIGFPLLSDFEPKGAVARAYGVYRQQDGYSGRALVLIDGDGVVRWTRIVDPWIDPGSGEALAAIDGLLAGDVTASGG